MIKLFMLLPRTLVSFSLIFLILSSCSGERKKSGPSSGSVEKTNSEMKRDENQAIVSSESIIKVNEVLNTREIKGKASVALLYYLDQPAHRLAVLKWLEDRHAEVQFESQKMGYLDALIEWKDVGELIATAGDLGLDEKSLMKLEVEDLSFESPSESPGESSSQGVEDNREKSFSTPSESNLNNTLFTGPVHSAGYGAKVEEFRDLLAKEFHESRENFEGQGTLVSVFDGGVDFSRTDVFQDRIDDLLIGDHRNWLDVGMTLEEFIKNEKLPPETELAGLDLKLKPRFCYLDKEVVGKDLNGSGSKKGKIAIAVYENSNGLMEARFRPSPKLPFGDSLLDWGVAKKLGKETIVNLYNGRYYRRTPLNPSPSAIGIKLRTEGDRVQIAFVGLPIDSSDHGISNLHMVGGDYRVGNGHSHGNDNSRIRYHGVAPQTHFLIPQTWIYSGREYGSRWIPLARTIIQSAEAGADVIDLDIYAPGTRQGADMLSELLCRVVQNTNAVPVVASHNYGPLSNTVQNLSQTPCVLGVGASQTLGFMKNHDAGGKGIDPSFADGEGEENSVHTALYSGRGFGLNGLYKPDIISPAYAYTAYGKNFIRFGGTSGATPATAGMVALLKQAARRLNVELNFFQIRFLLQGGSDLPDQVRDGYGYANLKKSWELFHQFYDLNSNSVTSNQITPFFLVGQKNLQFTGRPTQRIFNIKLSRYQLGAVAVDAPTPMVFHIRDTKNGKDTPSWLRFFDVKKGVVTDTLEIDAPMGGESTSLQVIIDLPDALWNQLLAGDHVAVIEGVRKELQHHDFRNVDFLLPVSFTKPLEVDDSYLDVDPLYVGQYRLFKIATKPGDVLYLSAMTQCESGIIQGGIKGDNSDEIAFLIDPRTESEYPEGDQMMNTYAPLSSATFPLRIVSQGSVVHLAIARHSTNNHCSGPISAELHLQRFGLDFVSVGAEVNRDGKRDNNGSDSDSDNGSDNGSESLVSVTDKIMLTLTGNPLNGADLVRSSTYNIDLDKKESSIILSRKVDKALTFTVPPQVRWIRVIPDTGASQKFEAVLVYDDEILKSGDVSGNHVGGFGLLDEGQFPGFGTLLIQKPREGSLIHYIPVTHPVTPPATPSVETVASAIIEMAFPIPNDLEIPEGLQITSKNEGFKDNKITKWLVGERFDLRLQYFFSPMLLTYVRERFELDPEWSGAVEFSVKILESMVNIEQYKNESLDITSPKKKIWSHKWRLPIF